MSFNIMALFAGIFLRVCDRECRPGLPGVLVKPLSNPTVGGKCQKVDNTFGHSLLLHRYSLEYASPDKSAFHALFSDKSKKANITEPGVCHGDELM